MITDTAGTASFEAPVGAKDMFRTYTFFSTSTTQTFFGTSTNATSTNIIAWTNSDGRRVDGKFVVAGAKRVTMLFGRGDALATGNTGSSRFKIQTSPDGTTWNNFYLLLTGTSSLEADGDLITNRRWHPYIDVGLGTKSATTTISASLDLKQ